MSLFKSAGWRHGAAGTEFTFQYVSILIGVSRSLITKYESFTFQYVSILIIPSFLTSPFASLIYIPICFYFNTITIFAIALCNWIYIPICFYFNTHRPNSRFFSTLFPHFLLTSQSLQIFYHISFINSTKEKQNHLFFMFVEFCRCTGIFTLSEGDSLKIVGTE